MKRKILFLSGLLALVCANVLAVTPAERYVTAEEKKYIKYCKNENKKGRENLKSVTNKNAFESVMLFECFKKEADYLKAFYPRGMEDQINNLLEAKIAFYNEKINTINDKFNLNIRNAGSTVEEIIIEKQIYIKREDDERITREIMVEHKITTLEDAITGCKNRGFRPYSSDPLESYLFDECIKEFGFTPPTKPYSHATNLKIEKTKKAEAKNQQKAKPAPAKIIIKEEAKPLPVKPAKEDLPTVKKEEPLIQNATPSEGKVVCKVDAYGTRICRYEPKMKKNEGSFVNNLYLD